MINRAVQMKSGWCGRGGAGRVAQLLFCPRAVDDRVEPVNGGLYSGKLLLKRIKFRAPFGAQGGLGGIEVIDMLQAVTHRHLRRDSAVGIVSEDLFVVVGCHVVA